MRLLTYHTHLACDNLVPLASKVEEYSTRVEGVCRHTSPVEAVLVKAWQSEGLSCVVHAEPTDMARQV